jgi:hypothetical protein
MGKKASEKAGDNLSEFRVATASRSTCIQAGS